MAPISASEARCLGANLLPRLTDGGVGTLWLPPGEEATGSGNERGFSSTSHSHFWWGWVHVQSREERGQVSGGWGLGA